MLHRAVALRWRSHALAPGELVAERARHDVAVAHSLGARYRRGPEEEGSRGRTNVILACAQGKRRREFDGKSRGLTTSGKVGSRSETQAAIRFD